METTRFILIASLGLVIMLLWAAWQKDYGVIPTAANNTITTQKERSDDIPQIPSTADNNETEVTKLIKKKSAELISVETDLFSVKIDTHGGNIIETELLEYPLSIDQRNIPVKLLKDESDQLYIIQGGILSGQTAPTHDANYTSQNLNYILREGQDVLEVPLYWQGENGIEVRKIYEFYRDKYNIKVRFEINNKGTETWSGRAYGQIQRSDVKSSRASTVYTYTGAVISSPEKRYEKISFDDLREEKLNREIIDGWAAFIQHYFITALIPGSRDQKYNYYSLYLDKQKTGEARDRFVVGITTPQLSVSAGEKKLFDYLLFIGPKLQHRMEKLAPNLELTVDYGKLWFIAKPLFWCLEKFHGLTGNWGWSIILVTLMLKILFYNLSAAGYRSMARMRQVQPKLVAMKERYKNDRARMNKAMMDLYKQEKINPLGGCFPILIQIPVFIALYWVLLESVELRQTGFILWIKDLSTADPYFVLPVIMGITMFVQQKLNPAPMDPVQQKVMSMLPLIFTVFFAFFPSGLVLYWVVNNILSIAQQWLITRNLERAGLKR